MIPFRYIRLNLGWEYVLTLTLSKIYEFLTEIGMQTEWIAKTEDIVTDQLLIHFVPDEKERERSLQIHIEEQDLSPIDEMYHFKKNQKSYHFLHFLTFFPFQVEKDTLAETCRFIALINRGLPILGLYFSEPDRLVFFRHTLFCSDQKIDQKIILTLINSAAMILDQYSDPLEEVTVNKKLTS